MTLKNKIYAFLTANFPNHNYADHSPVFDEKLHTPFFPVIFEHPHILHDSQETILFVFDTRTEKFLKVYQSKGTGSKKCFIDQEHKKLIFDTGTAGLRIIDFSSQNKKDIKMYHARTALTGTMKSVVWSVDGKSCIVSGTDETCLFGIDEFETTVNGYPFPKHSLPFKIDSTSKFVLCAKQNDERTQGKFLCCLQGVSGEDTQPNVYMQVFTTTKRNGGMEFKNCFSSLKPFYIDIRSFEKIDIRASVGKKRLGTIILEPFTVTDMS